MTIGTTLAVVRLLLSLAAYFARRAERDDIARGITAELEALHGKRVDKAVDARNDVVSGRVQPDPHDPDRRD